ncbi:MAG: pyridoxal phosphate-dependent aminotransferase [Chloroflexi bacterium]|nr:MAG: pyridoxal phosphate-dependent aminotransferase [Chloroflexota bacterium]
MTFNFDQEVDRIGTYSVKWEFVSVGDESIYSDAAHAKYGDRRLLPLWVADMDFQSPPAVIDALGKRVAHGIFGYTKPTDSYFETVIDWISRRYGYAVEKEWIELSPGVVPALHMLVETFLQPGEKVLIQRPVYYPFFSAVENNGCEIVSNSLVYENGRYHIDFDDLAQKAADPAVKMAILCSPHNPVGRVWTREELTCFAEICMANDVLIVSDEIHCDLIVNGHTFTSLATISEQLFQNSIICTAPSKTFNLAGLKTSNIIIPNREKREAFHAKMNSHGVYGANVFGPIAAEAAYNHGEPWLEEVLAYIEENYHFLKSYLAENLPQLKVIPLEGTYLVWVDCRTLGLDSKSRKELMMECAKVYLDEGELFGPEGEGFERFNLACPRSILAEALERIKTAVSTIR